MEVPLKRQHIIFKQQRLWPEMNNQEVSTYPSRPLRVVTHASYRTERFGWHWKKKAIWIISTPQQCSFFYLVEWWVCFMSMYVFTGRIIPLKYYSLLFIYLHSYSAQGTQCAFATQLFIYIRWWLLPKLIWCLRQSPKAPSPDKIIFSCQPILPDLQSSYLTRANQCVVHNLLRNVIVGFPQRPLSHCFVLMFGANY